VSTDTKQKIEAQAKYCRKVRAPMFAPEDGHCYACGRQIYDRYTVQQAGEHLITGCPYCNRSYCE